MQNNFKLHIKKSDNKMTFPRLLNVFQKLTQFLNEVNNVNLLDSLFD